MQKTTLVDILMEEIKDKEITSTTVEYETIKKDKTDLFKTPFSPSNQI